MKKIYWFEDNIDFVKENRKDPRWDRAYRFFFPEISRLEEIPDEDKRQTVGIDYILHLQDGTQYYIDEKVARSAYPFPIEIWQDYKRGYRGWAMKEGQKTDYIVYLIKPLQHYYLIPYKELKDVYRKNEEQWLEYTRTRQNGLFYKKVYNNIKGGNVWETHNVFVPFDFLMEHIPGMRLWKANQHE